MTESHIGIGPSTDIVTLVEKAVVEGNQATIERVVNRSRWDMEEPIVPATTVNGVTAETVQQDKPKVETIYRGDQPVTVFKPGVNFSKGESIHF